MDPPRGDRSRLGGSTSVRILAESPGFREVLRQASAIASSPHPVLLVGETGVGKEEVARFIHFRGLRRERPFVAVNCAGISETMLLSEMFGHVRGAFTGAEFDRLGHLRAAGDGTLLLDEIGDLPATAQATLLRALDGLGVYSLGCDKAYCLAARVIAATEQDLSLDRVKFRAALYQRLSCHVIRIPPLRERREDILPLAEAFLQDLRERGETDGEFIGERAREALLDHAWPGNVRELRNLIIAAVYERAPLGLPSVPQMLAGSGPADSHASVAALRQGLSREPSEFEIAIHSSLRRRGPCSIAMLAAELRKNSGSVRLALLPLLEVGLVLKGGRGRGSWVSVGPAIESTINDAERNPTV